MDTSKIYFRISQLFSKMVIWGSLSGSLYCTLTSLIQCYKMMLFVTFNHGRDIFISSHTLNKSSTSARLFPTPCPAPFAILKQENSNTNNETTNNLCGSTADHSLIQRLINNNCCTQWIRFLLRTEQTKVYWYQYYWKAITCFSTCVIVIAVKIELKNSVMGP